MAKPIYVHSFGVSATGCGAATASAGRDSGGLAPIDISLDGSLRSGDVVATANGLVAYTGIRVGNDQTAEFTPVASYPGLTADVRARLGEGVDNETYMVEHVDGVATDVSLQALALAAGPPTTFCALVSAESQQPNPRRCIARRVADIPHRARHDREWPKPDVR